MSTTLIQYGPHQVEVRESFDEVKQMVESNWSEGRRFAVTTVEGARRMVNPRHVSAYGETEPTTPS